MARIVAFLVLAAALAAPATAQRQSLGVFGGWAAFRDQGRCYAIASSVAGPRPEGWRAFLSVGHWPARGPGGQVHVRLSRAKRDGSAVLLRIDGQSYQLVGSGRDAWAPDGAADDAILTAMRTGLNLVVETRAANGVRLRDGYQLRGAATAIDAAALACRPRR
ncbi:MAG: hypothetical protein AB7U35_15345 [Sphingobium sp.]